MDTKIYIYTLEEQAAADGVPYEGALVHFLDYLLKLFSTDGYLQGQQATLQHLGEVLREKPLFGQLAIRWMSDVADALDRGRWFDAFGTLYEEMFLLKGKASKKGQFFTPQNVSNLMAEIITKPDQHGVVNDARPAAAGCFWRTMSTPHGLIMPRGASTPTLRKTLTRPPRKCVR